MEKFFYILFVLFLSVPVFSQGNIIKQMGKGVASKAAVEGALRPITVRRKWPTV